MAGEWLVHDYFSGIILALLVVIVIAIIIMIVIGGDNNVSQREYPQNVDLIIIERGLDRSGDQVKAVDYNMPWVHRIVVVQMPRIFPCDETDNPHKVQVDDTILSDSDPTIDPPQTLSHTPTQLPQETTNSLSTRESSQKKTKPKNKKKPVTPLLGNDEKEQSDKKIIHQRPVVALTTSIVKLEELFDKLPEVVPGLSEHFIFLGDNIFPSNKIQIKQMWSPRGKIRMFGYINIDAQVLRIENMTEICMPVGVFNTKVLKNTRGLRYMLLALCSTDQIVYSPHMVHTVTLCNNEYSNKVQLQRNTHSKFFTMYNISENLPAQEHARLNQQVKKDIIKQL